MKVKKSSFVYGLICDTPVCLALCLTSNVIAVTTKINGSISVSWGSINWLSLTYNFPIALFLAMLISCFVPLVKIGKWFTGLFGIDHETFKGNLPYRLLAMFSSTMIFFIVITPSLNILNCYVFPAIFGGYVCSLKEGLISLGNNTPFMILIGYIVSLIADIPAYKVAHHIDPEF